MNLLALTYIASEINAIFGSYASPKLSFEEVEEALKKRGVVKLLASKFADVADFSGLKCDVHTLETGIAKSAERMRGMERRRAGVVRNGLALIQAIILDAIREHLPAECKLDPPDEWDEMSKANSVNG